MQPAHRSNLQVISQYVIKPGKARLDRATFEESFASQFDASRSGCKKPFGPVQPLHATFKHASQASTEKWVGDLSAYRVNVAVHYEKLLTYPRRT